MYKELTDQLIATIQALPPTALETIRQVQLRVKLNKVPEGSAQYDVSEIRLLQNGYKAGAVEISNADNFINRWQTHQPWMVLHEMAHAFQFGQSPGGIAFTGPYPKDLVF